MGEPDYEDIDVPCFYYYESFDNSNGFSSVNRTVLTKEQLKQFFDIEIIAFSFQPPIVNIYK